MNGLDLVPSGARFVHYKGGIYIVVGHTRREADGEILVSYVPEGKPHDIPWSRPLSEWFDKINVTGIIVQRFTELP